ncbi:LOW QUALITY PROTEIN: hypothetical protein U9M48_042432 [Paspalum notatum var. saurae]|uniref:Reverse transcriptase domain-containing protein n=1 Tax=Paspalum notatum var. saurae TaxID=547442 RepID=A0AAQ3UX30_PASNO
MFRDISKGDLPLFSLNFGVITLVPKVQEANVIQQYRPICLLNVSYKIFTKVTTNRLSSVANKVVSPTQTAFIKGRNILEGVVILHEAIQELDRKNKADVQQGEVALLISNAPDQRHYFQTKKGLWHGDPLSPLLFNIMVDMSKVFISRAKTDGQLEGVIPHLVEGGSRFSNDTILFVDHDPDKDRNMKLLLFAFEQASGLKINSHKSELFCFRENIELYTELFGWKAGNFPTNYFGIPIHYRKLRNCDWGKAEERFEKRLSSWKGKHLSIGGRLTLINSVLSSLPMYMMSFFSIPKGVLKKLDYFRSRFFWQGDKNKKKYGLARWTILCQPKDQGGLGILDLNTKNTALLSKWLYKLLTSDGLWQQMHRNKYVGSKPLAQVERKSGDSLLVMPNEGKARFSTLWNLRYKGRITNQDAFHWNLAPNDRFSVKSHYAALMFRNIPKVNRDLWKLKVPLNIKFFLWYLQYGVILTKDNLAKLSWQGSLTYTSCHKEETINHLFLV